MNSYNELIGLPIFIPDFKKKIATVNDILFDKTNRILIGLIVEKKRLFSPAKYIPLDDIEKITTTSIAIRSRDSIKSITPNNSLYKLIIDSSPCSIHSSIYANDGKKVGKINDIIFNFEVGLIDSYIVSNGVIEDIISGRKIILDEEVKIRRGKLFLNK